MSALVNAPICPLMLRPAHQCERADEALLGMTVEVSETAPGPWCRVQTHYGYVGYAPTRCLLFGEENVARFFSLEKQVVTRGVCDVLSAPRVQSWPLITLVRGCLVSPVGVPDQGGWQKISLPDGREGYLKSGFLGPYYQHRMPGDEAALRAGICAAARFYLGTAYRWGGKTPMGIDCSGLCAMAYLLCGVTIWRDAQIKEGYPIHSIDLSALAPADLLFFPGHVAMYLGEGRYVHATAKNGCDGVVINSLNPRSPDYRPDLAEQITAAGSIF